MSSWEQPLSGQTPQERRLMYAKLTAARADELYPGDAEPGRAFRLAAHREVMDAEREQVGKA